MAVSETQEYARGIMDFTTSLTIALTAGEPIIFNQAGLTSSGFANSQFGKHALNLVKNLPQARIQSVFVGSNGRSYHSLSV